MGVSETEVPVNTRDVLEKGLTVGSSAQDVRTSIGLLAPNGKPVSSRLRMIIHQVGI